MKKGYISALHKNTLAYNLSIHLEKLDNKEDIYKTVITILTNFEYKEDTE